MPKCDLRTPRPKCDFNKVLRDGCSPVNLHIFRTSFRGNTSGWLLLQLSYYANVEAVYNVAAVDKPQVFTEKAYANQWTSFNMITASVMKELI